MRQFLAMRQELAKVWQPQLLDQLAQAHAARFLWLERHFFLDSTADPEAAEQAAAMADRFNRVFLRTLRALQDLRRRTPAVILQNVGQVKIGGQEDGGRDGDGHAAGTRGACACRADWRSLVGDSG